MRKYLLLLLAGLLSAATARAQLVTTDPLFPSADAPVTITFDVTESDDSRAEGLLGLTSDVFLWSGVGNVNDAFQFQPPGQTNFSQPFPPGTMTSLGEDRWSITLTPRTYADAPAGAELTRMGTLLKNGNGSAQTEDFIITLYPDGEFNAAIFEPTQPTILALDGETIGIRAAASQAATLTLFDNGTQIAQQTNATEIDFDYTVGTNSEGTILFEATNGTDTVEQTFTYVVRPDVTIEALPSGVQDGINENSPTSVTLSLFAPGKEFVYVIGDFTNWQIDNDYFMRLTPDGDRFWLTIDGLTAGEEYGFQYLVDGEVRVGDPYAEKILSQFDQFIPESVYPDPKPYPAAHTNGTVAVLQTDQEEYVWQTTDYVRPAQEDLVIYELLVRDFVEDHSYRSVIDSLSYLQELGVNAIELMPVSEFSGNLSWGYNPTYFFASDKYYGTKNELKELVDSAHARGIAVILDVVYNHADRENPYVKMWFTGSQPTADNPFFNQQATHPFSVFYDFNHEFEGTQQYVDRANRFWLEEYRIDGYRFDLSKGFTQTETGGDVGAWSAYDQSRVDLLLRMYNEIRAVDETAYVIFEHLGDNSEEIVYANAGIMLWSNLQFNFSRAVNGVSGGSDLSGQDYRARGWEESNLIAYMESHDEERLMYEALEDGNSEGDYDIQNIVVALNRVKQAAAFYYLVPGPKMLWQFGELGYDFSINRCPNGTINGGCRTDPKPVRWDYYDDEERRKLFEVFSALINLKIDQPTFRTDDFDMSTNGYRKRVQLNDDAFDVNIVGNFDTESREMLPNFQSAGTWYDFFSGDALEVTDPNAPLQYLPGEFHIYTTQPLPTPPPNLLTFGPVTSLPDATFDATLAVYPNPVRERLTLGLENPATVRLVNQMGQVVRVATVRPQDGRAQLDVRSLPTGLYVVEISDDSGRRTQRFVKR